MKRFVELVEHLDATRSTAERVALMAGHFRVTEASDAALALYFLCGRQLPAVLDAAELRRLAIAELRLPEWLFDEAVAATGDPVEAITLMSPAVADTTAVAGTLSSWVEDRLPPLARMSDAERHEQLLAWWRALPAPVLYVLLRILLSTLSIGASRSQVLRALGDACGLEPEALADRLVGDWPPTREFYLAVTAPQAPARACAAPYPFFLPCPVDGDIEQLGARSEWLAEWQWDGIRSQLIRRGQGTFLWSSADADLTPRYPEIIESARQLATDVVLDGVILGWRGDAPLPPSALRRRSARAAVGPRILEDVPAIYMACDLLELDGRDVRSQPLETRRAELARQIARAGAPGTLSFRFSAEVAGDDWPALAQLRARAGTGPGLMLKRRGTAYGGGHLRGDFRHWQVGPVTLTAVLTHAHADPGRNANYSFGVWDGNCLATIARTHCGLDPAEFEELDRWIRAHTVERRGHTRVVQPELVFELGFESLQPAAPPGTGIFLKRPRIVRWQRGHPARAADSLESVRARHGISD